MRREWIEIHLVSVPVVGAIGVSLHAEGVD